MNKLAEKLRWLKSETKKIEIQLDAEEVAHSVVKKIAIVKITEIISKFIKSQPFGTNADMGLELANAISDGKIPGVKMDFSGERDEQQ